MIMSASFVSAVFVDRLGWVLVHSVWQLALIAVAAMVLAWGLRRTTAAVRYWGLLLPLLAMIIAPVASWCFLLAHRPSDVSDVSEWSDRSVLVTEAVARREGLRVQSPGRLSFRESDANRERGASDDETFTERKATLSPVAGSLREPSQWWPVIADFLRPWLAKFVLVWCVGVLLFAQRPLLSWYTVRRLRTVGVLDVPENVESLLERAAQRLGVRRAVQVLQSTLVNIPIAVGYFRPAILLPVSIVTGLPTNQLEAILAHELAHIRRHDYLVNLIQTLVETVFFYHPAVWWLSRRIRIERENSCDDLAVAAVGDRVEYGRALLAIAELRVSQPTLALGAGQGFLLARVQRLVSRRPQYPTFSPWPAIGLTACCLGLVIGLAGAFGWAQAPLGDFSGKRAQPQRLSRKPANSVDTSTGVESKRAETKPLNKPLLEFRIAVGRDNKDAEDVAWFPIIKPRMPLAPGRSAANLPVEQQIGDTWRGLLWTTPEHTMPADGSWHVLRCDVVPGAAVFPGKTYRLQIVLDKAGGAAFRRLTRTHLNQKLAIVVDGTVISAPVIRSVIGARCEITGSFSREEAERLARTIRAEVHSRGRDRFEGAFQFDERVPVKLTAGTPEWPDVVRVHSIEFQREAKGIRASVQISQFSWPPSSWRLRIQLTDETGKQVASAAKTIKTAGVIVTERALQLPQPHAASFGPVDDPGRVKRFELSIVQIADDRAAPASQVTVTKPAEAPLVIATRNDLPSLVSRAEAQTEVSVPNGTYSAPITVNRELTLKGKSPEDCILEVVADRPAITVSAAKSVTIESMTIKWQLATSDRRKGPASAIFVKDGHVTLRNCRLIASGNGRRCPTAVACQGFSKVTIENCWFEGFEFTIGYGGGAAGSTTDCVILNSGHCGLSVYSGSTVEVARNIIAGSKYHGIRCTGGKLNLHDNLIIKNKNRGIYLGNKSARGRIHNNVILGNGTGISAFAQTDVTIENNVILDSGYAGLDTRDSCSITVRNNLFLGNTRGIVVFKEIGRTQAVVGQNSFWKNETNAVNFDMPDITILADPHLTAPEDGDFTAQAEQLKANQQGLSTPETFRSLWKKWEPIARETRNVDP